MMDHPKAVNMVKRVVGKRHVLRIADREFTGAAIESALLTGEFGAGMCEIDPCMVCACPNELQCIGANACPDLENQFVLEIMKLSYFANMRLVLIAFTLDLGKIPDAIVGVRQFTAARVCIPKLLDRRNTTQNGAP